MGVALEPEMFPDVIVEEAFVEAPELLELVEATARKYDEHHALAANLRAGEISIACVWETKPFDPSRDEYKPHVIARVRKVPVLWRCLTGYVLVLQFRRWFWQHFTDVQREAVVFHELSHIRFTDHGIEMAPHDLEEFAKVVRHFGHAIPGRRAFLTAYLDWTREQLPIDRDPADVDPETGEIVDRAAGESGGNHSKEYSEAIPDEALRAARSLVDMGAEFSVSESPRFPSARCPRCGGYLQPGEIHETAGACEAAQ
jgi:hypothetical protein